MEFAENQDISGLTLKVTDISTFDKEADSKFYKIIDAPNEITGEFKGVEGLPDGWVVKYAADRKSVSIYHPEGLMLIVR